ncbi:hypothetical protein POREN0001_0654 [Porphyromonas endodontalis ATCC 35406]|uniref:Uncharacterized protein n=1 Tax=Porphyromonas endodontalis (strain ATCC 35406 / DSM 24491 / JCM 8526 / CCUG 16442 / BCRC 14492 / NCTC 13058 / HG 370) TaxID=553175 RepID=C3JCX1_POREA|nr:hypothetical protein POREN0001_0654 [Porphyromonas endodontalis ATCC 35406]
MYIMAFRWTLLPTPPLGTKLQPTLLEHFKADFPGVSGEERKQNSPKPFQI